jgi:hypothetical protein
VPREEIMIMTEHPELGEAYDLAEPVMRAIAPHENNFECTVLDELH